MMIFNSNRRYIIFSIKWNEYRLIWYCKTLVKPNILEQNLRDIDVLIWFIIPTKYMPIRFSIFIWRDITLSKLLAYFRPSKFYSKIFKFSVKFYDQSKISDAHSGTLPRLASCGLTIFLPTYFSPTNFRTSILHSTIFRSTKNLLTISFITKNLSINIFFKKNW